MQLELEAAQFGELPEPHWSESVDGGSASDAEAAAAAEEEGSRAAVIGAGKWWRAWGKESGRGTERAMKRIKIWTEMTARKSHVRGLWREK